MDQVDADAAVTAAVALLLPGTPAIERRSGRHRVGSYERAAFCGNQASLILPPLEKHGAVLWMPEVGGPVTSGHGELIALSRPQQRRHPAPARRRSGTQPAARAAKL
jgi:hypothetical protein